MEKRLRHSFIIVFLVLLALPAAQTVIGMWRERPLHGIGQDARRPQFSVGNWFAGTLQDSLLRFGSQQIGLQPTLVRLNNQLYYSLFNTAQANKVTIGKNGVLYDPAQIESAKGMDYVGVPPLQEKLQKFMALRELLRKKGITLAMVMVPGKGLGLPESIPDHYPKWGSMTNFEAVKRMSDSLQLPLLDLVQWYDQARPQSPYPMYAATGNHWSEYCATLAADTLFGYLEKLMQADLNRLVIKKTHYPIPASPVDNDLNLGMNLLFTPSPPMMAYSEIGFEGKPRKLRVLTIGDSFYSKLFTEYSGEVFEQSHFWFYFREFYRNGDPHFQSTAEVDIRKEIESQDVILLYMVDSHVRDLGFGFVEAALDAFNEKEWVLAEIARIKADIRGDVNWMAGIEAKALAGGVSVDSMLMKDAIWVLENSRVTLVPH